MCLRFIVCLPAESTKREQIYPFSIAKVMFKKMILRSEDPGRPKFYWCENGTPEEVSKHGTLFFLCCTCVGGVDVLVAVPR